MGIFDRNPEGGGLISAISTVAEVVAGGGGGGETNTASNLGGGSGIFNAKVGVDLQFKSLVAGTNITLTPSATEILIDAAGGVPAADSIDGTMIRLDNDQFLRARNFANSGDVNLLKLTAGDELLVTGKEWSVESYAADWWGTLLGVWGDPFLSSGTFGGGTKDHTPNSATAGATYYVQTGSSLGATATGETGQIFHHTGDAYGTNGRTGDIGFETGTIYGAANNSNSGNFQLITGSTKGGTVGGFSFSPGTSTTGSTQSVVWRTGNSSSGGTTGPMIFRTGSTSGTQGEFVFQKTGVANSIGDVWTATSVGGQGYWAAPAGGGADADLNNLAAVDLNQDLTTTKASTLIIGHNTVNQDVQITTAGSNGIGQALGDVILKGGDQTGAFASVGGGVTLQAGTGNDSAGPIKFINGSEGTAGWLWTSTGTGGEGSWVVAPGSVGDAWGDPVDANIVPDAAGRTLGGSIENQEFDFLYANKISGKGVDGFGASGALVLITQAATGGLPSGGITLQTGSTSGTAGEIVFINSSGPAAAIGQVWTATSTGGAGYWAAPAGGGDLWSDPVDANIIPDGNNTRDLGSSANNFANVYSNSADLKLSVNSSFNQIWGAEVPGLVLDGTTSDATTAGATGILLEASGSQSELVILTADQSGAAPSSGFYWGTGFNSGTGNTGTISLFSGDQSGASGNSGTIDIISGGSTNGNSGNISLQIGAAGGTPGKIRLRDGSQGTIGHVWTSTGTLGEGTWAPATGITWSTQVNANIIPDGQNTRDLGGSGAEFANLYVDNIYGIGGCGVVGIDVSTGLLIDQSSVNSLDWDNRHLVNASGAAQLSWGVTASRMDLKTALTELRWENGNGTAREIVTSDINPSNADSLTIGTGQSTGGTQASLFLQAAALDASSGASIICNANNFILPKHSADPTGPFVVAGSSYYNTTSNKIKFYNGSGWETVTSA